MKVNWWGQLVVAVGLTSLLMPWGQCYNGAVWQNCSLIELLGRSDDILLTMVLGLFFVCTLVTVRTNVGGIGQVLFGLMAAGMSGVTIGIILGTLVGAVELYLLFSMKWYYNVVDDDTRKGPSPSGPYYKRRETIWSK